MSWPSWKYDLPDTLIGFAGFLVLFACLGTVLYSGGRFLLASGKVDYCHVTYSNSTEKGTERDKDKVNAEGNVVRHKYVLMGHRAWREDRPLSQRETLTEIIQDSDAYSCEVRTK